MYHRITATVPRTTQHVALRSSTTGRRTFVVSRANWKGSQNSTPGWEGRSGDDHVLHRDGNDTQSANSQDARKAKEQGGDGSSAISQKDELNANQKAKEDHPEAPGPVIGMNSERGGKAGA